MKLKTLRTLAAGFAAIGLVAVGCGDDGTSSSPSATTGASGESGTTTTAAKSAAEAIGINVDKCPSGYNPTQGVSANEILVGQSVPKTGPAATYSLLTAGMKGYFDYANAELNGVNGRKIRLLDLDDGYEPARTAQNVDELLNDGVFVTSGILGTPQNLAVRETLNDECVPQLFPSTGAAEWGNAKEFPWTVGGAVVPYNVEARIWSEYLKQKFPNGATIAALQLDNEFGKEYEDWLRHYLQGSNITIKTIVKHDPNAADIRNQMTTLAASNADVAIAMTNSTFCSQFMKAFEGSSWQPLRLISGTCKTGILFVGGGGGATNSEIVAATKEITDPSYANDPDAIKIRDGLAKYAPNAPASVSLVPIGWLYAELLRDVFLRAEQLPGGLTRPNVVIAARQTDFKSPLLYPEVPLKMNGLDDTYVLETARIEKWNGTTFEKVTDFFSYEGETKTTFGS